MAFQVYVSSKIVHIPMWLKLREKWAKLEPPVIINSSWIDSKIDKETSDNSEWGRFWIDCINQASACDALILYAKDKEERKKLGGSKVEAGAAISQGKVVIYISTDFSIDSFSSHPLVLKVNTIEEAESIIIRMSNKKLNLFLINRFSQCCLIACVNNDEAKEKNEMANTVLLNVADTYVSISDNANFLSIRDKVSKNFDKTIPIHDKMDMTTLKESPYYWVNSFYRECLLMFELCFTNENGEIEVNEENAENYNKEAKKKQAATIFQELGYQFFTEEEIVDIYRVSVISDVLSKL